MRGGMRKNTSKNNSCQKTIGWFVAIVLILIFISGQVLTRNIQAQVAPENIISYQGRILNAAGVPVSDASLSMKFELYSAASGGTCLWSNSSANCDSNTPASTTARTTSLTSGLFSELLGDTTNASPYAAIDDAYFSSDSTIFLQVYIGGETLTPRKQLVSVPYALNSSYLDGYDSADLMLLTDGGATTYLTSTTDDFAIGGSAPTSSAFGIDESANTIYIGDGSSASGSIVFKASDADTGTLSYGTDDTLLFTGGDISVQGLNTYPATAGTTHSMATISGTYSSGASGAAGTYSVSGLTSSLINSAAEASGIMQVLYGGYVSSTNSGSGELETLYGTYSVATNTSTSVNAIAGVISGIHGQGAQNAATLVTTVNGVVGEATASAGTTTLARGVYGTVSSGGGTITTSISGDFINTALGATRYGIRSGASSGTTNYSGYFYGSPVFIDNTTSPSTPLTVDSAGDLYVYDQLEVGGNTQTTGNVIVVDSGNLTTGNGLRIQRTDSGSEFTGTEGLVNFTISDTNSSGHLLYLNHDGPGTSLYIDQTGDDIAMQVSATGITDYMGTFFNDGNADTNMGFSIQACADASPDAGCNYIAFKDGDGTILGAIEGDGIGGVTLGAGGIDYAELFPGNYADFAPGDVIGLDSSANAVIAMDASNTIGAYSVSPNTLGNWVDDWQATGVYVPVALLGQVPINVNDSGGAIAVGDFVALSTTPGVGKKATGAGYVLGRALEAHSSGNGTIMVLIRPIWSGVDILSSDGSITTFSSGARMESTGSASASTTGFDSGEFLLRGSGWNGASADNVDMSLVNSVTDSASYGLSIRNSSSTEVAYISNDGDLAISGRLYPSDRGVLQTDKYIYYDGSSGGGGDFMRTNASGWGAGSYDFAEMFPSKQMLAPGEVVIFANSEEEVERSIGEKYDQKIAGVVSTQPGFLAGENLPGYIPVALAGRVPTYVSGENGAIDVGDPLTTSTKGGYAMKATQSGPIVGYAMESFSGNTGVITAFVRPSYYDGGEASEITATNNIASGFSSVSNLDLSGSINYNGGSLISVGSLSGIGDMWSIKEDGTFTTNGRIIQLVHSYQGENVETYPSFGREITIQLSGTVELDNGSALIDFDKIDEKFNDIISTTEPYRVFLTATGPTGTLYAINRTTSGFTIQESTGSSSVNVDWLVIAYHKDFVPDVEDEVSTEPEEIPELSEDDETFVEPIIGSTTELEQIDNEAIDEIVPIEIISEETSIAEIPDTVQEMLPLEIDAESSSLVPIVVE